MSPTNPSTPSLTLAQALQQALSLLKAGNLQAAEEFYRAILAVEPTHPDANHNLAVIAARSGDLQGAEQYYQQALKNRPDSVESCNNLGNVLKDQGKLAEAEACFRKALQIRPTLAELYGNLGLVLKDQGRFGEAEVCYRQALEIRPDYAEAHNNLGITLKDQGKFGEAEACYREALQIRPGYAEAHNNLGNILKDRGSLQEADISYRQALQLRPNYPEARSNLLFVLNYSAYHPDLYLAEAHIFGQLAGGMAMGRFSAWCCPPQPGRLRIGLVSGDLGNHPVGYFLESVLGQLDPARLELFAYPTGRRNDELTARIKPAFSAWQPLTGLADGAAARLIHDDGVHILLDLSGHTAQNRLPLFAWKPAPVQATWLGYLASTGVAEIDYLLGDPYATPPEYDGQCTEKVWRMPEIWACFSPPQPDVEPGALPALANGFITFGCFNNLTKMNDAVVALWARILQAVPTSRLFLKTKQLNDVTSRENTRARFAAHGIAAGRLLLEGASPRHDLLAAYNNVDIALDPFPYGGGTTSFETLWMAVPIITRTGNCFLSRCGHSLAMNAGLSEWIAGDDDEYVAKALQHSSDITALAALRGKLRSQVRSSPLFDAQRFAKNLETALWGMWEQQKYT